MTETLHLTPREVWEAQAERKMYVPEAFEREGFIHCTDGVANVIEAGNRYYVADARPFVCLVIDLERLTAPVKYEDAAHIFPHIYGPLNTDAVVRVRVVRRDTSGDFLTLDD